MRAAECGPHFAFYPGKQDASFRARFPAAGKPGPLRIKRRKSQRRDGAGFFTSEKSPSCRFAFWGGYGPAAPSAALPGRRRGLPDAAASLLPRGKDGGGCRYAFVQPLGCRGSGRFRPGLSGFGCFCRKIRGVEKTVITSHRRRARGTTRDGGFRPKNAENSPTVRQKSGMARHIMGNTGRIEPIRQTDYRVRPGVKIRGDWQGW